MRNVAIELTGVVRDDVMRRVLIQAVVAERAIRERLAPADEQTVIVDRVGVIDGQQQLAVEPVDGAAIAMHAVENVLAVEQLLQPVERLGLCDPGWCTHREPRWSRNGAPAGRPLAFRRDSLCSTW